MNAGIRSFAVMIAAVAGALAFATVSAQTGPANPMPTPLAPPPPPLSGPNLSLEGIGYPFDYHFGAGVHGFGFRPGEQVTISVQNVSASPVTVTVGGDGTFVAHVPFTWVFCGPNATRQTAPIILARGNQGSSNHLSLYAVQCPMLTAQEKLTAPPAPAPGTGVNPGATAVAPPPVVATVQPVAPGTGSLYAPPAPASPVPPRLAVFEVQGFGFASGEQVTVHEIFGTLPSPSAVHSVADVQGRLRFTMQANVPGHCSFAPLPELVAVGDAGTAVRSPLGWRDPIMSPCVVPPGGLGVGSPPPPGVPVPSAPAPAASPGSSSGSAVLSVSLHPSVAHRGGMERASLQATGYKTATLKAHYPGRSVTRSTAAIATDGRATLRWRIPQSAGRGTVRATVTLQPGRVVLQLAFKVR